MPLYEYKCKGCDKVEDRVVGFDKANEQVCRCGSELVREWSIPFIRLSKEGMILKSDKRVFGRRHMKKRERAEGVVRDVISRLGSS